MKAEVESISWGEYHTVIELSLRVHCGRNKEPIYETMTVLCQYEILGRFKL